MEFIVREMCQVGGEIRREGSVLTMGKSDVKRELALGKHGKTGKWISAILNHCEPADDETYEMIFGKAPEEPEGTPTTDADRVETIRVEMDEMGAAYDRRWKLPRMENELVMAKKTRGI